VTVTDSKMTGYRRMQKRDRN